jgi:hypothetical protein
MFQDSLTKKIAEAAAKIKTEPEIIKVNEKSVEGAVEKIMNEKLIGNQHKIDANKNNKVDAHDFKLLRAQKEKEKANSMKYGKGVKEQVKPEVEKSFPATGVTKHAPIKGVNYMPKDKEKANSQKFGKDVKEETEEIDEATPTAQQVKQGIGIARDKRYAKGNVTGAVKAMDKVNKGIAQHPVVNKELRKQNEETEQILEYESKGGVYKHKGTYGTEKSLEAGETNWDYEEKKANSIDPQFKKEPKMMKKKYGARQNYVRSKKVSGKAYESFSEIINSYKDGGLKTIAGMLVKEEPDNEEFTKEVEDQKSKMDGKKKGADIAKGSVQSVKNEETEIEVTNADIANSIEIFDIAEREMTDTEMKKREDIVKGMKKGMAGFKQRYGDRAKNVMYATATKQVMKD